MNNQTSQNNVILMPVALYQALNTYLESKPYKEVALLIKTLSECKVIDIVSLSEQIKKLQDLETQQKNDSVVNENEEDSE